MLREPMGLGWPVAAALAGLLVAVVGVVYVSTRVGPPEAPFQPVASLDDLATDEAVTLDVSAPVGPLLVVRGAGVVRVFANPGEDVAYCRPTRRLEGSAGSVWRLDGQRLRGPGDSLAPLAATVHGGMLYVRTDLAGVALPPLDQEEQPTCRPG